MRNAEVITAISAKIAAAISEATGTTIPAVTIADINAEMDANPGPYLCRPYLEALRDDALRNDRPVLTLRTEPDYNCAANPEGDILEVINNFALYISDSHRPINDFSYLRSHPDVNNDTADEELAAVQEDAMLNTIPRAYWPDAPNGSPRTGPGSSKAAEELDVAFGHSASQPLSPILARVARRYANQVALRFVPADFVPEGEGAEAEAERQLAGWAAMQSQRDELVLAARAAGVTKTRIHQITGMSRATIDRIPGV